MKHAGEAALDRLEPVLKRIRALDGLKEKKRGTFYRGSIAFLHFHEDLAGMFADVKVGGDFIRMKANTAREIDALIREMKRELTR
jgi:hypothetical protein